MKIRLGFVSNSSSSSFVLICDKKPTKEDLIKDLYICDVYQFQDYGDVTYRFDADTITTNILLNVKPATKEKIEELFNNFDSYEEAEAKLGSKESFEKLDAESKKIAKRKAKEFFKKYKGKKFFKISYADDTPFGAFMEHGIFSDIKDKCIRFPHH